jgi:hypothetical protein
MLAKGSNSAPSKAALLAAESAGKKGSMSAPNAWPWGNSAANQAFSKSGPTRAPADSTTLNRQRSLRAAKGAMAARTRPRAKSTPLESSERYPGQANATANALSAATIAHQTPYRSVSDEAGAVPYTTMSRQMFTSHPPVKPEVDEQKRNDVIHASAVAMAKKMYTHQQRVIDATKAAQEAQRPASSDSSGQQPAQYTNLQEAAYKLAQERLSKLQDEHQKSRDFQEYYGTSPTAQRKLTVRGKLRRRSSSDGAMIEDRERSMQIRKQMSLFSTRLSEADEQKRKKDREAVLAAAQRNVSQQLKDMDERVYAVTGMVTPTLRSEWETRAHTAALAKSEARKTGNEGKIDIGGGMFMDPKAVDKIAAKRVQPILDEINDNAEKDRARLAKLKAEEEAKRQETERARARDREVAELHEKIKRTFMFAYF